MSSSPDPMYLVGLEIAGVSISIQCFRKWTDEISFIPFMKSVENPDFRVTFRLKEKLPELLEDIIHEDNCYRIHPNGVLTQAACRHKRFLWISIFSKPM